MKKWEGSKMEGMMNCWEHIPEDKERGCNEGEIGYEDKEGAG